MMELAIKAKDDALISMIGTKLSSTVTWLARVLEDKCANNPPVKYIEHINMDYCIEMPNLNYKAITSILQDWQIPYEAVLTKKGYYTLVLQ